MISGEVLSLMGRNRTSQKALAAVLGMKQSSLSARLNCVTPWKVDELELIAAFYDVPVTNLLSAMSSKSNDAGQPPELVLLDGTHKGPTVRGLPLLSSVQT